MNDDKKTLSFDEAVKLLPAGATVHTFRQAGPMMLGADHTREGLLAAMKAAPEIQVTGPSAQAMKHGLAIEDDTGWLFIESANAEPSPGGDDQ
jgi:hypothetical protein